MSDEVSISIGSGAPGRTDAGGNIVVTAGKTLSGWQDVSITLRAEGFPNQFTLSATEKDPASGKLTPGNPGDLCFVRIGDDTVVTGYINRVVPSGDAQSHSLTLVGRGKCQDLVDCSAEWPTGQMIGGDALTISSQLADVYGIDVQLANGASAGPSVTSWALNYTETPAAIVQRVAQNAGLLAYEDAQGRLLLSAIGTVSAKGGVEYGRNVERWSVEHSDDQRFSDIVCSWLGTASLGDLEGSDFFYTEADPNVRRHRQLDLILAEVAEDAQEFTKRRAKWEVARRAGRALVVSVTVDSWRDANDKLWTPNTIVPVRLPDPRLWAEDLVLSEVTFHRSDDGTHAGLVLMPRQAFALEPINLQPVNAADVIGPPASGGS